jgi:AmiR/NasT family two-component response regulator
MQPGTALRDQHVAIGILMERLRLDYDRALEALRVQARNEGRTVDELAASMVDAANRLNSVAR